MKYYILSILFVCFSASNIKAQRTTVFTEANASYKKGLEFFEQGVFAQAQKEFKIAAEKLDPLEDEPSRLLRLQARLFFAKSAIMNEDPEGEKLILEFTKTYKPDPIATQAVIEIADYYYNKKEYDKALSFFQMIDQSGLTREERGSLRFKQGYCYFVKKDFKKARTAFYPMKDEKTDFFFPINYYYGLTAFYEGDYNEAVNSFKKLETSKKYQKFIPYYLCQIYFAQKKYDELIKYGSAKFNESEVNDKKELGLLVGQAYYEKKMYTEALPYLEFYAQGSPKMRENDFYQLAYTQYKAGFYAKAAENFEQLTQTKNALGQNALFCLSDCYLRLDNKQSARSAFRKTADLDFDKNLKEEALFNFSKLSYELKNDREAIETLETFQPSSKFYNDAQNLMGTIFQETKDYENAIKIMDGLKTKTPKIQEAYQKVALLKGMQLISIGDDSRADEFLTKSLNFPIDGGYKSQALYWKADIAHKNKQYDISNDYLNKYATSSRTTNNIPEESSPAMASYLAGYNYFKQKQYGSALNNFEDAINKIKRTNVKNETIKQTILPDASLRAGDCYLSKNNYNSASKYYNEVIDNKYNGYVYAIFQSAIIKGLKGKKYDKAVDLQTLIEDYPKNEYADEALFELGGTYQELNENEKAKKALKTLVTDYKNKSDLINKGLLRLALIYYNQGDSKTAIDYYKQVLDNNPTKKESADALAALEEIYVKDLGQPDEYFAIRAKTGYSVSEASKDSVNFQVAESQYENGNYDKAVLSYTNYINKYPKGFNVVVAYFHRGESYFQLKDYKNAAPDLEFALQAKNSSFREKCLGKLGFIAYSIDKNYRASYDYFTQLEELTTADNVKFEAQIGAMQSAYKNADIQAVKTFASKVSKNPKASKSQVANASFYLGKIEFDGENYSAAIPYLEKVSANLDNETAAEARYLTAESYFELKNLDKAEQICINSNKESAGFDYWIARSVILLSDINVERDDLLNARAALEAVIDNYSNDKELVNIAQQKLNALEKKEQSKNRIRSDKSGQNFELQNDK
jgi:tetratricopeptide (TPR) repeat protein